MLEERNAAKIDEAKKEVAWNIEFHTIKLNKLKSKFYDVLEFEKFTVKAIKTVSYVTTFRVHKMSEFLQRTSKHLNRCWRQISRDSMDQGISERKTWRTWMPVDSAGLRMTLRKMLLSQRHPCLEQRLSRSR
jgi:cytochrome c biogenesis protein ResB